MNDTFYNGDNLFTGDILFLSIIIMTQIMTLIMTAPSRLSIDRDKAKKKVHTAQKAACTELFIFADEEASD